MAISFNTGATNNSSGQTANLTLTIPAGVAAGDVMLLVVQGFSGSAFTPTVASTGTAFTQIGATESSQNTSGFQSNGSIWKAVASGSDAGKVITVSGQTCFWGLSLAAYTGASNTSPVDVSGGAAGVNSATATLACPPKTTTVDNDWAVYLSAYATNTAATTITLPAGTTSRENSEANSSIGTAICDSNGSVGLAGTGIGGGVFTAIGSINWLTAFTVGLAPAGGGESGTFNPVLPAPSVSLAGQLGHGSTFAPVLPGPSVSLAGLVTHLAPFNIVLPRPVMSLQGTTPPPPPITVRRSAQPDDRPGIGKKLRLLGW